MNREYLDFVNRVSSPEIQDDCNLIDRLLKITIEYPHIARLLNSGIGLSAESSEFLDIVKKIVFQQKELDESTRDHLIRELGDVCWYMAQACMALDVSFDDVVRGNQEKLQSRFTDGVFDVEKSEKRSTGDL